MIGLVVVSHSRRLAEGVAELAGQMAPDVTIAPAGGDGDGGLGTDYVAVTEAIEQAGGDGVVVVYDLGSARMVADMAAEEAAIEVRVVDAPLVEGAVAAAVAAQGGANLEAVAAAARQAAQESGWTTTADSPGGADRGLRPPSPSSQGGPTISAGDAESGRGGLSVFGEIMETGAGGRAGEAGEVGEVRARVVLTNSVGLHARPAALVARAVAGLDARVVVRFDGREADATSVLALMGLGAAGGALVEVVAAGVDAVEAVRRVEGLAARGFDE
ncbi:MULTISPECIES: dihydroxyacetone kinase phosphoryl donor subunit DhaM [unclassified Saccharothrix]|uniref:dihydroxyacetone kinase phosphoryl donor subunit DhaM n=1 Tax=unclassified Saccharothrix TaxID=2593673 RepID=UPI00307E80F3